MPRVFRVLIALAGLMGACGVALAAVAAHGTDSASLSAASSMLLFHASAVLATVALAERGLLELRIGTAAGFAFVVAAGLFAGDITMRHFAGHRLFPFAAPTGGTLLIASWLALAVAALAARRK